MPSKPSIVHLPEMALTMVRRVTAKLPFNHYLFRVDPKYTKNEIQEYLEKVYNVKVSNITTSISLGKTRRVPGRRQMFHKLKDYKRALVRIADEKTFVAPSASAGENSKAQLQ